jgi:hypothetical protein
MSKHHHHHPAPHEGVSQHGPVPYWKRAHTDWRFWIGVVLMFLAMIIYLSTLDLAWRPGHQPRPPQPADVAP